MDKKIALVIKLLYTEIGSGYANTGCGDFYGSLTGDAIDADNVNGGLVYMGDVGYEFLHLSLEFGVGFHMVLANILRFS